METEILKNGLFLQTDNPHYWIARTESIDSKHNIARWPRLTTSFMQTPPGLRKDMFTKEEAIEIFENSDKWQELSGI